MQESIEQQWLEKKRVKKDKCIDISSDKQAKFHTRRLRHV